MLHGHVDYINKVLEFLFVSYGFLELGKIFPTGENFMNFKFFPENFLRFSEGREIQITSFPYWDLTVTI